MASSRQGTLINVLAGYSVHITELVTSSAVALIGAVDIGTLLATRVAATLIHIFTRPTIQCQTEAHSTAAVVGSWRVLTLVGTQAPGVAPALVDVHACPADTIKIVTSFTLAAETSRGVHTEVAWSTGLRGWGTFVHINTAGSLLIEMVATPTIGHILPARIGALRVDACLAHRAWGIDTQTLIWQRKEPTVLMQDSPRRQL